MFRELTAFVLERHGRTGDVLSWASMEVKITENSEHLVRGVDSLSPRWQRGLSGGLQSTHVHVQIPRARKCDLTGKRGL